MDFNKLPELKTRKMDTHPTAPRTPTNRRSEEIQTSRIRTIRTTTHPDSRPPQQPEPETATRSYALKKLADIFVIPESEESQAPEETHHPAPMDIDAEEIQPETQPIPFPLQTRKAVEPQAQTRTNKGTKNTPNKEITEALNKLLEGFIKGLLRAEKETGLKLSSVKSIVETSIKDIIEKKKAHTKENEKGGNGSLPQKDTRGKQRKKARQGQFATCRSARSH